MTGPFGSVFTEINLPNPATWFYFSWLLAVALSPMSALAVAMVLDTGRLYPQFGTKLAVIVLTAVGVLEIIGPLATQFALIRAGEAHPEKRD